jgi:glycosyltransferase involved in cell wall biosynthesis
MRTIYILALEPLDTRYTGEWFVELPRVLNKKIRRYQYDYRVIQIDGYGDAYKSIETTPGAFLNFTYTNIWKNNQINKISELFSNGSINPGDKFLVTDAWHSGIIQIKYMSELMDIPVEIHSIWHAGSYDPQDFLGRKVKDKSWSFNAERAYYFASDYNYFASKYHCQLIDSTLLNGPNVGAVFKRCRSGFPFEYLHTKLEVYTDTPKEDIILFPHRIAPEKQLEIFMDLKAELPQYQWIVCQHTKLTKDEYHQLLGKAKMVFSANLQETLGISMYEGICANALPLVPDRLSYTEMYADEFKYPSVWTEDWKSYTLHKEELKQRIIDMMNNYKQYCLTDTKHYLTKEYFSSDIMLDNILNTKENED